MKWGPWVAGRSDRLAPALSIVSFALAGLGLVWVAVWLVSARCKEANFAARHSRPTVKIAHIAVDPKFCAAVASNPPWIQLSGLVATPSILLTWYWRQRNKRIEQRQKDVELAHAERSSIEQRHVEMTKLLASREEMERIGAIYALRDIARDSPGHRRTIAETLAAFIRTRERPPAHEEHDVPSMKPCPPDVSIAAAFLADRAWQDVRLVQGKRVRLDLQGAYLFGASLRGASFAGANLRGAVLNCADLREANLVEANLENVELNAAELDGAQLTRAILRGVRAVGAKLQKANLESADLTFAQLEQVDLREANLSDAVLRGARFYAEDLKWKDIKTAHRFGHVADLRLANLSDANLVGANLVIAKLEQANLQRAKLQGADLKGARLDHTNMTGAEYDGETEFPEELGYEPHESGALNELGLIYRNNDLSA